MKAVPRGESRRKSQALAWVYRASTDTVTRVTESDYVIEHGGAKIGISTLGEDGRLVSRGCLSPDEGETAHTLQELLGFAKKLLKLKPSEMKRPNLFINDEDF